MVEATVSSQPLPPDGVPRQEDAGACNDSVSEVIVLDTDHLLGPAHHDIPPDSPNGRTDRSESSGVLTGPTPSNAHQTPESSLVRDRTVQDFLNSPDIALYSSHALATWGQRMWEFAVGLVMLELRPESLQLVAVCGLLGSAAKFLAGGPVGKYIDRTERYTAASSMYILQNAAIAVSAAGAWLALQLPASSPVLFWLLTSLAIVSSAVSSVGCMGSLLSVEREWTKTLCDGDSDALAQLNAGMQRIDLVCLIASPLAVGLSMTWTGVSATILAITLWNTAAWLPECWLLRLAQERAPVLRAPSLRQNRDEPGATRWPAWLFPTHQRQPLACAGDVSDDGSGDNAGAMNGNVAGTGEPRPTTGLARGTKTTPAEPEADPVAEKAPAWDAARVVRWAEDSSWAVYVRQPTLRVAGADALLYLTVMSLGLLMTAYLKWMGVSEVALAVWRSFGAVAGVAATYAFPHLRRSKGLDMAGMLAIWPQVGCLLLAVAPALLQKLGLQLPRGFVTFVLMAGVAASRYGLWCFDLAGSQILQERVASHELGTVVGVQASTQSLLAAISFVAGLVVWRPQDFIWLMLASCAVISCAGLLFTSYALPRLSQHSLEGRCSSCPPSCPVCLTSRCLGF